ncbi:MAG TPA: hypothetical protein VMW65_09785 [Chloroflexota bacterium]|nr:hypothetical protein [Chloroflexota bacterium]
MQRLARFRLRVPAILLISFVLVTMLLPRSTHDSSLDWELAKVTRGRAFDIWTWEIGHLTERGREMVTAPPVSGSPVEVERYNTVSEEARQAQAERDTLWARRAVTGQAPGLTAADARYNHLEAQLTALRPVVESTVSVEISRQMQKIGLRRGWLATGRITHFPFLHFEVMPPVFFQLGPLPNLLVVAPRDRIELIGSVLVQPGMSPDEVDRIENQADVLGVSSVVTGIGGLAAYPSMLPDANSTRNLLITVAHEWTHQFLIFHPLGQAYFSSYDMREINETVADMVGQEVGGAVFQQDYASSETPTPRSATGTTTTTGQPNFGSLMRQIRLTTQGYLNRHDVAGADAYMKQAQQDLARRGYYVPRLNTAYLAFFGSYSGTANPYEAKLRRLRQQRGSLRAFLDTVAQIRTPEDLDRLVG